MRPWQRAAGWLHLPVLMLPVIALAQEIPNPPAVQAERVVVEEAAPKAPAGSSTRATLDDLEPAVSGNWGQVTSQVPNLEIESAGPSSFGAILALRGLANTPYFSDPAVTLYMDDIPMGGGFTYPAGLFGFVSATVLSGPHGAEFGRSEDGGIIVLSPRLMTGGDIRAGFGDYGARSFALEAGAAEGENADVSVAFASNQRDGYIENTQIGQRVDNLRALDGFARERFRPTRNSEITVELLDDQHRDGAAPLVPLGGPLYTVERSHEGATDSDLFGASLKAALGTDIGNITTVTSFTDWKLDPYEDWLVLPPAIQSVLTQEQQTWNEELRLSSKPHSALAWNVGGWLSDRRTSGASNRSISGVIPIELSDYGFLRHEAALFGELTASPLPGLHLSIGGRLQRVEESHHQDEEAQTPVLHLQFERANSSFLPTAAATYEFDPRTTLDAGVSTGSRAGGYAAFTSNPSLIPFAAEHVVAFESGVQRESADRTLSLSARAFDYEIINYQIERSFSAADYFVATAPRARSLGAELTASWKPTASWIVGFVAGLTDVTLIEFNDPLTGKSYAGNRAPYTPSFTTGLQLSYRSAKGWFATAEASAAGKTFYTESEDPAFAQGEYTVLGMRTGFNSRRWRITLYVENAGHAHYYSQIIPGVKSGAPGVPRILGSEVMIRF
jgi:iron complex outermembrane receptor protein